MDAEGTVNDRDMALLLLNEESWVALGAMLSLKTWLPAERDGYVEVPPREAQPA